jgi:hypothetical protein
MIPNPHRSSELAMAVCFLAVIFAVPLAQTGLELARGERVQFTDVFRDRPTAANLRQYEKTLEEKSWAQQQARPLVQEFLFDALKETGAKAMRGVDGWVFYRPDVRYVLEPDRVEVDTRRTTWVRPSDGRTRREHVVQAIVRFREQLKARGIELVVMPVPGKPSVYPDKVTRRVDREAAFCSPTSGLLEALNGRGIATVDLFRIFREHRRAMSDKAGHSTFEVESLYLATDTHWTPRGAQLAARTMADKVTALGAISEGTHLFKTNTVRVTRRGDVLDMMQIPGVQAKYGAQTVECEQVSDASLGLLVPSASDRPGAYKYPGAKSPVLVLGDSFCRIYQYPEPQSLGEVAEGQMGGVRGKNEVASTKKLLPGSAGFISHLARSLGQPVDAIVSDGGASTDVRKRLSMNPEILEGKKVVVWEFVERDISLGREGWEEVSLPRKLD